jgi:uncharacterized membrane protein YfbV (UPF0208 family)
MTEYGEPVFVEVGGRKTMVVPTIEAELEGQKWKVKGFVWLYVEAWRTPEPHVYTWVYKVEEKEVGVGELGSAVEAVMAAASAKARALAEALRRDAAHVREIEVSGIAAYVGSLPEKVRELWAKG